MNNSTPEDRLTIALGERTGEEPVTVFAGDVKDCGGDIGEAKRPGEQLELKASEVKGLISKGKKAREAREAKAAKDAKAAAQARTETTNGKESE